MVVLVFHAVTFLIICSEWTQPLFFQNARNQTDVFVSN